MMSVRMESIMEQWSVDSGRWPDADEETLSELGFYWRERDEVRVLVCRPLEDAGFANGFSTRLGGVSNLETVHSNPPATAKGSDPDTVGGGNELNLAGFNEDSRDNIYENRRRFLSLFPREYRLATAWQVHGDSIRFVRQHSETG